jgi:hypothetical protein
MIRTLINCLMLVLISSSASAASFADEYKSAQAGDVGAMHNVGAKYANGKEVQQDYAEAAKWFERAAFKGQHNSMYSLAVMNRLGQGGEVNLVAAYAWYSLAAEHIPKDADEWYIPRAKVAMFLRRPAEIAALLNASERQQAEKLKSELAQKIEGRSNSPVNTDAQNPARRLP